MRARLPEENNRGKGFHRGGEMRKKRQGREKKGRSYARHQKNSDHRRGGWARPKPNGRGGEGLFNSKRLDKMLFVTACHVSPPCNSGRKSESWKEGEASFIWPSPSPWRKLAAKCKPKGLQGTSLSDGRQDRLRRCDQAGKGKEERLRIKKRAEKKPQLEPNIIRESVLRKQPSVITQHDWDKELKRSLGS